MSWIACECVSVARFLVKSAAMGIITLNIMLAFFWLVANLSYKLSLVVIVVSVFVQVTLIQIPIYIAPQLTSNVVINHIIGSV